jgi:curved DNA-binding protein CbpA
MPAQARDPYQTLGVGADASDRELRAAYRRLVQRHHPDHNGGSAEAARRFEEVQEAYARIRELRKAAPSDSQARSSQQRGAQPRGSQPRASQPRGSQPRGPQSPPRSDARARRSQPPPAFDPDVEARAAALERELKQAHRARERARQAAAERARRPSDEELGYVNTDDSFAKIIADARAELSDRLSEAHEHPVVRRVSDLIDELDALASKLTGEQRASERQRRR